MKILRVIGVLAVAAAARAGLADYPDRPIKVLMPFPPGGTVDVVTRLVCNEASEILRKPFVLDYRPGAAGIIATEATANRPCRYRRDRVRMWRLPRRVHRRPWVASSTDCPP